MRRLLAFLTAVILLCASVVFFNNQLNEFILKEQNTSLWYSTGKYKFSSSALLKNNLSDNMLVLGSSELETSYVSTHPVNLLYDKGYDFNMYFVGSGNYLSLWHTIYLGANAKILSGRKAVLMLSPQWFLTEDTRADGFCARYNPVIMNEFLSSDIIDDALKNEVKLSAEKYGIDLSDKLKLYTDTTKNNFELYKYLRGLSIGKSDFPLSFNDLDLEQVYSDALNEAANVSNNEFDIYDSYYNVYIKGKEESAKYENQNLSYENAEFYEFELFLRVAKQANIEVMIMINPFQGKWYDFIGFDSEQRDIYYDKCVELCEKYDFRYINYQDKEYTQYFLCDISHLGWGGWCNVIEDIHSFGE